MLSNAYFLAKFRFDTAENEPAENLQNFAKFCKLIGSLLGGGRAAGAPGPRRRAGARLGDARRAAGQRLDLALPRSGQLRMRVHLQPAGSG